nr:MAG TPA: hypothetical protein [Caudoviricetes sp.]
MRHQYQNHRHYRHHRHRRVWAGCREPFSKGSPAGESTAVDRGSAPLGMYWNTVVGRYIPRNSLGEPTTPLQRS